jgi:hypothetical protein
VNLQMLASDQSDETLPNPDQRVYESVPALVGLESLIDCFAM